MANVVGLLVPHIKPESILLLPLTNSDDDFLDLNPTTIASQLPLRRTSRGHADLDLAAGIIARIRDRNLFVCAYAFSHTMPHDPFRDDPRQKAGLEHLRRDFGSNPAVRAVMLASIVSTTEDVVRHARDLLPTLSDNVPLKAFIALDPFGRSTKMNEIARAYLVTGDRKLVKFKEDSAESPAWSNAYLMTRDTGYVFTASEYAPAVFLACEAVFRQRYGVRTPPSAIECAKVDKVAVERIRSRLADRGFYTGRSADLRPMPQRLKMADVSEIVRSVTSKLRPFQPFAEAGGAGDGTVDEQKVLMWPRQFEGDEEIDCALRMLEAIKVLNRSEVRTTVDEFITANHDFKGCHVCQLGGPRDSSSIITYFVQDLAETWDLNVVQLQQALAEDERPILFVDDFLGTGRQSVSIVKHWLDEPYEEQLEEDHGPKLTPKQAQELTGRPLGFAFVYGTVDGKDRLGRELGTSGIQPRIHIHQDEADLPRAFSGSAVRYPSSEAAGHFQARCRDIGQQLLESQQVSAEKVVERTLGYGNNAYLVLNQA